MSKKYNQPEMQPDSACQHNMIAGAGDMQLTRYISLIKSHSKIRSCSKQTFGIRLHGKIKALLGALITMLPLITVIICAAVLSFIDMPEI